MVEYWYVVNHQVPSKRLAMIYSIVPSTGLMLAYCHYLSSQHRIMCRGVCLSTSPSRNIVGQLSWLSCGAAVHIMFTGISEV